MELLLFMFVTVIPVISDGLTVLGPSGPLVAPLGSSVVLPCSVDELLSVKDLEVEWRRTDSETLVHLYQDGESQTESQQQDYQDRANFFTDQIQHGNFSLRLDDLRAGDEGQYKCKVYIQQESGETAVQIKVNVERLIVSGSDQHISASVGEDVTLSCSVDSHIPPGDFEEVSWTKTDEDIQVLLYQDNEAHSSNERYIDRVELFPAEIPKGNFSLRLKSVRTEDKGVYMCKVFAGGLSANATVVFEQLGFSASHIMILIFCISASGSALLLFYLIYCRSPTKGLFGRQTYYHYFNLGSSVVLPCHVDECLLKKTLKVEWRRKDTKTLVHLYEDGASRSEKQHKDYQDRAHFFTDDVHRGNFSLRLDNLRAEDAGEYICTVHSDLSTLTRSAKTSLEPRFKVKGSSDDETIPLGGSVVLSCQVDESLIQRSLKVEWRRADSESLVHLYEDGESRPKKQNKDYHHRAHFITDEIKEGNFSIRLEKLRAEDAGKYTCKVYIDQDCVHSADAELEILRFNVQCHTFAPLGSSVVLPSYKYKPLSVEGLKVEWRRKDTLVHLYQDGESRAEEQDEDYKDRAHFFTDQIQHGDFSLHLDNLKAGDEGKYICTVYSQQKSVFSAWTNLELRLLDTVFRLQMFLVFCPNVLMFLAFVLWGVSEGSLFETVSCCALYFLRPFMLLWTAPYINKFTGNKKTWVRVFSFRAEYIVFSAVFYSVLFKSALDKSLNYTGFEGVMIIVLFVIVILFTLLYITFLLLKFTGKSSQRMMTIFNVLASISLDVLPSLQFILLFTAFGSARGGFIIVAVLPVFTTATRYDWDVTCGQQMGCSPALMRSVWLILMMLINAVLVYFYITALENEKDRVGWVCVIVFLQSLWTLVNFTRSFTYALTRFAAVYVFGSVCVVLLNSVALMIELILKTVNGEGAMGDMRIIVFSSELLFTLILMILLVFEPWITPCLQSCTKAMQSCRTAAAGSQNQESQNATADSATGSNQNQNPAEAHEMSPLLNTQNQENSRSTGTEEAQPDSVVSQS